MNQDQHEAGRRMAWDCYFAGAMSISLHPGATRDSASARTVEQCALIADHMLIERDRRFKAE